AIAVRGSVVFGLFLALAGCASTRWDPRSSELPPRAIARLGTPHEDEKRCACAATFSRDGSRLIASDGFTLREHDLRAKTSRRICSVEASATAISPDLSLAAFGLWKI